ncbi:hypothetical protein HELRODRAFT_171320 [Helobdella robusta]|uniref:Uncharacterized protein n=1 Tax=Helobdella robusta TaxID=6412 RepID=T1F439_HELRO|nr:hypothetical protein HELRODRAFT_171320 [Helobdella robusta]ESO05662.1 hypothetical protein HELRODRAFT_171320 [Helobdella robusta]
MCTCRRDGSHLVPNWVLSLLISVQHLMNTGEHVHQLSCNESEGPLECEADATQLIRSSLKTVMCEHNACIYTTLYAPSPHPTPPHHTSPHLTLTHLIPVHPPNTQEYLLTEPIVKKIQGEEVMKKMKRKLEELLNERVEAVELKVKTKTMSIKKCKEEKNDVKWK